MPRLIAITLVVLTLSVVGRAQCSGSNFEPGQMSESELKSEFEGAVVRVQAAGSADSGTGYLIDAANGFIVTAFHVVQSAAPGSVVDIQSPKLKGVKLGAIVVKTLAVAQADGSVNGIDIALLKLDNPALAKDIRPVDISLRFPAESATLYAMGYPLINASEPNNTFTEQPVQLIAAPPDGSIEVRQAIYGGNSGGPLMDPTGSVIGTCRESVGIGATVARYIAMSDAVDVLNLVPMSERISVLDQRVLGSQISEPELKALLIKSSTTPTNIELYEWARHIIANRNQYTSASTRKLLQCPIKALMQRGMDDLVLELSNFGNEQVVGDANMNVAQRELARGRPLLAETHIQKAAASYQAVGDQVGITRASLLSASSELATGSLAGARAESNKVLTKIDLLSASEKAEAFATSAKIDLATGDTSAAIEKFGEASSLFIHSGRVSSAAEMLLLSADASLKVGKSQDAARSLTEAFQLFKEGNNEAGAAESVYELVKVDTVVGDKVAMQDNLHKYLDAAPSGIHAPEVKEMLEAKPQ